MTQKEWKQQFPRPTQEKCSTTRQQLQKLTLHDQIQEFPDNTYKTGKAKKKPKGTLKLQNQNTRYKAEFQLKSKSISEFWR